MSMKKLIAMNDAMCTCGKQHCFSAQLCIGNGVISQIPKYVQQFGSKKVFVLSDENTYAVAGKQVCDILAESGIPFIDYHFTHFPVEPDAYSVGAAVMHYDPACDFIIGVGSGVINDIGKILSYHTGRPYMIVATAPSMDGYASATSSMTRDGLKISLPSRSADVIVGDTAILRQAPLHMMKSGLGDMLAKYVSICEWRIAHLIIGEYYCEEVADLIRSALKKCIDHADGLLQRDADAVQAVFEGLVIGGVAMKYAGLSRPASGIEHYISHILDMRAVEFGTPTDLHGIQCAVGTLIAVKLYEKLKAAQPDKEKALAYVKQFDFNRWSQTLRSFLGKGAESMIAMEEKDKKYDKSSHKSRLDHILNSWDAILQIMDEELSDAKTLESLLDKIQAPKSLDAIGIDPDLFPLIFASTKDIRDKYVLSRLAWDLGILDEIVK